MQYYKDDEQDMSPRSLTEADTISFVPGIKNIPGIYDNEVRPYTPSEYARYNGWSAPLHKRDILSTAGLPASGYPSRLDNAWQRSDSISAILDSVPTLSSDAFTAYLDTLPPMNNTPYTTDYTLPGDSIIPEENTQLSLQYAPAAENIAVVRRPYLNNRPNLNITAPVDNTRISIDYHPYNEPVGQKEISMPATNWQNTPGDGVGSTPQAETSVLDDDISVYAQIFKKYLPEGIKTYFVQIPVPYSASDKNFREALLPDDTKARKLARGWWKLSMFKNAPEAYAAMEHARRRGDDYVWVPDAYVQRQGLSSLAPYHWQKKIYNYIRQNGDASDQLWRDLTGIKEWDFNSLYDLWLNPKIQDPPFALKKSLKDIEEPQKNLTFDKPTLEINRLCKEDKEGRFYMTAFDAIKDSWLHQPTNSSCLKTCVNMLKNFGHEEGSPKNIIPFTYQRKKNGDHYYYNDRTEMYQTVVNVVDRHLYHGRAIIAGLDYRNKSFNDDGTDHFVLLIGKGYDAERKQYYYLYADPGRTKVTNGVSAKENRIYLDDRRCILSGNKTGKREDGNSINYVITHVRPNDGMEEKTESVTNIYNQISELDHANKQPFSYEKGDTMFHRDYRPAANKLSK